MAEAQEQRLQLQKDNCDGRLRKQELEEVVRGLEVESESLAGRLHELREQGREACSGGEARRHRPYEGRRAEPAQREAGRGPSEAGLAESPGPLPPPGPREQRHRQLREQWEELSSQLFYFGGEQLSQQHAEQVGTQLVELQQLELVEAKYATQAEGLRQDVQRTEEAWVSFQKQSGVLQIKEYEKLDNEEDHLCRSRQIYDAYIMKELLSCSHPFSQQAVEHVQSYLSKKQVTLTLFQVKWLLLVKAFCILFSVREQ